LKPSPRKKNLAGLGEANGGRVLTEALTADVESVLADQTSGVSADTALAGALAITTGVGVPDVAVSHFDSKILDEFKKECHLMSKLQHPNILLFMGACTVPGKLKLVTEMARNGSVEDIFQNKKVKLSFMRKMKIAQETAQGMNWLHCMKPALLHLDLKTANLLLTTEWHVKIADFGLSRVRGDENQAATQGATVGGTPFYMSPELFMNGTIADEKCDIYAYGITLWELVSEKRPYDGLKFSGVHGLVSAILNENLRPPIPGNCPDKLRNLIQQCWGKDPKIRPSFQVILNSKIFDEVQLEAVTTGSKECMKMWKSFGPDNMYAEKEKEAVVWDEFLPAFCKMVKVRLGSKDNIKFQCLRAVLDVDKEPRPGSVTQEAFQRFLQWFGPISEGAGILDQVKGLLEQKWFHGVMTAREAENKITPFKKGTFLVRFSSRGAGAFTLTFVDKDKKKKTNTILNYDIPDPNKLTLQNFF